MTVTAINNEMEEEVQIAGCGDNVRVRLRGVEDEDILVGFVLTSVEKPVHVVQQFEAQLVILDHKNIICAGYGAVMHVHTAAEEVSITVSLGRPWLRGWGEVTDLAFSQALLNYYDKKTGRKSRQPPKFAKKGKASSSPSPSLERTLTPPLFPSNRPKGHRAAGDRRADLRRAVRFFYFPFLPSSGS